MDVLEQTKPYLKIQPVDYPCLKYLGMNADSPEECRLYVEGPSASQVPIEIRVLRVSCLHERLYSSELKNAHLCYLPSTHIRALADVLRVAAKVDTCVAHGFFQYQRPQH